MKITRVIVAVVALALAIQASAQDKKPKEAQTVFTVNMHCENCEQRILKTIPFEKGVKDLTTDLERKLVTVTYRVDKTDPAKLQKAIEKLGYTCEEKKEETK